MGRESVRLQGRASPQRVGTLGEPGCLGAPPCGRSYSKCTRAPSSLSSPLLPPGPGEALGEAAAPCRVSGSLRARSGTGGQAWLSLGRASVDRGDVQRQTTEPGLLRITTAEGEQTAGGQQRPGGRPR